LPACRNFSVPSSVIFEFPAAAGAAGAAGATSRRTKSIVGCGVHVEEGGHKDQSSMHPTGIVSGAALNGTYESNASPLLYCGALMGRPCSVWSVSHVAVLSCSFARCVSVLLLIRRGKDDAQGEDADCLLCTTFGTSQGCVVS